MVPQTTGWVDHVITPLGAFGLIYAGIRFMNGVSGNKGIKELVIYGVLGAIFFFAGIGLVKHTHDRPSAPSRVRIMPITRFSIVIALAHCSTIKSVPEGVQEAGKSRHFALTPLIS